MDWLSTYRPMWFVCGTARVDVWPLHADFFLLLSANPLDAGGWVCADLQAGCQ